jgi:large subunit ribosomal protein L1
LNVDPKRGDHIVKGNVALPHGLGKSTVIGFFSTSQDAMDKAKEAGADIIGDATVLKKV